MLATFSQQLRYLRRNEPSLYESISKAYRKCLMESNLAPQMSQTDDEAAETPVEKTEIKQNSTKGVDDLMSKVHAMVGVNETKKEGDEIFDLKKDDVETVKPDPQQQADLFGEVPDETSNDEFVPEVPMEPANTEMPSENPPTETASDNLVSEEPPAEGGTNEPAEDNTTEDSSVDDIDEFDLDHLFGPDDESSST
jgi:hypothetical protein